MSSGWYSARNPALKAAYGTVVALPERERRCKPGSTSRSDP
jgi:hypothetical protein